jgi:hypothetical protein
MAGGDTFYVRFGYVFPSLCFAGVALMGVLAWRKRSPRSRAASSA